MCFNKKDIDKIKNGNITKVQKNSLLQSDFLSIDSNLVSNLIYRKALSTAGIEVLGAIDFKFRFVFTAAGPSKTSTIRSWDFNILYDLDFGSKYENWIDGMGYLPWNWGTIV